MSDEEPDSRRYLIVFRYANDAQDRERVIESARGIKTLIESMSRGECKLAWTSTDGGSFAYFLRCEKAARWIYNEIMTPGQHGPGHGRYDPDEVVQSSPMRRGDSLLVVELGEDYYGLGFSNAWTWLQHH